MFLKIQTGGEGLGQGFWMKTGRDDHALLELAKSRQQSVRWQSIRLYACCTRDGSNNAVTQLRAIITTPVVEQQVVGL